MTTTSTQTTLMLTDKAVNNLDAMHAHVDYISAFYGHGSQEHLKASTSLNRALTQMIALGGRISADSELGLYGITEYGMHYGVVFHARTLEQRLIDLQRQAAEQARKAREEGSRVHQASSAKTYERVRHLMELRRHYEAIPNVGEWSIHS
jgi:hypothetical protein